MFFMTYILPVLIVLALSALFAFFLSFLGEKLKVEKDPRIGQIRSHLPGANCGGCGYAGCDAYAEALFSGKADIHDCHPVNNENRALIGGILGVKTDKIEPRIATVYCNGGTMAQDKGEYRGYHSCQNQSVVGGGAKVCPEGCLGYGSCEAACQYGAIHVDPEDGVPMVDPDKCISCGACFKACPKKLIDYVPLSAHIYVACSAKCGGKKAVEQCSRSCISCGMCVKTCPQKAIKLEDNLARINYSKCTGCGQCVEKCPRKCILKR